MNTYIFIIVILSNRSFFMSSSRYKHSSRNLACANDNSLGRHTHTINKKTVALTVIGTDVALQANTEETKLLPELEKHFKHNLFHMHIHMMGQIFHTITPLSRF
jgi:hypothetical protein